MTVAAKAAWDDTILPFQLDRADVRGRVARLDATLDRIIGQHAYPPPVQALIAEAALLTALIGQTIKLRWKLSLQIRGKDAIRLIATDYFAPEREGEAARLRAYAAYDEEAMPETYTEPFALLGEGYFGILIDQGRDTRPYQGITPLAGGSLAACASTYFAQSEQLPTRFVLGAALSTEPGGAAAWRAGGVMVQHLPRGSVAASEGSGAGGLLIDTDILAGGDAENWNRVTILLDSAELTELLGPLLSPGDLLVRLFHEEGPRVFDAQAIRFGCTCTETKVVNALSAYSEADLREMADSAGNVTADCQFCGAHYTLNRRKLGSAR